MSKLATPTCGPSGRIRALTRYTAYVVIQYDTCVEFVQFDDRSALESVSKISLTEGIVGLQADVATQRYVFVQTHSQIYLYDCEAILQNQYQSWAPAQLQ